MSELTLSEQLALAKQAYHQLMIGGQPVEVRDSNGESVRYTPANAGRLKTYIAELEALVAGDQRNARRPFRPVWG